MDFEKVFKLLISRFQEANVHVALIGGFAMHAAGYSRATQDIDFLIAKEDVPKVKRILSSCGYELLHESEDVSNFVGSVAPLGRIDFLHAHRHYAKAMLARATEKDIPIFGAKVKVVAPEDIIGLKVQSSSNDPERYHQDMADIESLIRANKDRLDFAVVREYFGLFKRENELKEILERIEHAQ